MSIPVVEATDAPDLAPGRQLLGLAACFAVCYAIASVGAAASINAPDFYGALSKPDWAPPAWLFGPVWSALFTMMAVSAWLVWRRGGFGAQRLALSLFLVQLAFNGLWSWLFFAWQQGALALVDIAIFGPLIATTIAAFWRTSRVAALLLVPYLAWVGFAGVLNYSLWQLNPHLLGG